MFYSKLTSEQVYNLEKERLRMQYHTFFGLLFVVTLLSLSPLLIGIFRRPSDQVVNAISESGLLLTGSVVSAAGFFLGSTTKGSESSLVDPSSKKEKSNLTGDEASVEVVAVPPFNPTDNDFNFKVEADVSKANKNKDINPIIGDQAEDPEPPSLI